MTPEHFVAALASLQFEDTFNPYSSRCSVCDRTDAPRRRSKMLLGLLEAALEVEVDAIWIGRDLGYRGGRRTGLALTDDVHIATHAARWGLEVERPTKGEAVAERTAAVIWSALDKIQAPIFLWNAFPLHPHEPGDPFTNRSHNSRERAAGEDILLQLIVLLRPKRLVAIGNDAASTARRLAREETVMQVRHPSYGGQRDFLSQVSELYGIPLNPSGKNGAQKGLRRERK